MLNTPNEKISYRENLSFNRFIEIYPEYKDFLDEIDISDDYQKIFLFYEQTVALESKETIRKYSLVFSNENDSHFFLVLGHIRPDGGSFKQYNYFNSFESILSHHEKIQRNFNSIILKRFEEFENNIKEHSHQNKKIKI